MHQISLFFQEHLRLTEVVGYHDAPFSPSHSDKRHIAHFTRCPKVAFAVRDKAEQTFAVAEQQGAIAGIITIDLYRLTVVVAQIGRAHV